MLLVLMSLWTIFNLDSSWRYAKPFATPRQIFLLVGHSNFILHVESFPIEFKQILIVRLPDEVEGCDFVIF